MRGRVLTVLLLTGIVYGAQPAEPDRSLKAGAAAKGGVKPQPAMLPVATVRSSRGLVINGVRTPPGVDSVLLAWGDVVGTFDVPAVASFTDGRVVTLSPATVYETVPSSGRSPLKRVGATPRDGLPPPVGHPPIPPPSAHAP